jgi:hypothetical protein
MRLDRVLAASWGVPDFAAGDGNLSGCSTAAELRIPGKSGAGVPD